jgi:hypothetical protein
MQFASFTVWMAPITSFFDFYGFWLDRHLLLKPISESEILTWYAVSKILHSPAEDQGPHEVRIQPIFTQKGPECLTIN